MYGLFIVYLRYGKFAYINILCTRRSHILDLEISQKSSLRYGIVVDVLRYENMHK